MAAIIFDYASIKRGVDRLNGNAPPTPPSPPPLPPFIVLNQGSGYSHHPQPGCGCPACTMFYNYQRAAQGVQQAKP